MKRNTNQQNADASSHSPDLDAEELKQNELSDIDNLTEGETVDMDNSDSQNEIEQLQKKYDELNDSFLRLKCRVR